MAEQTATRYVLEGFTVDAAPDEFDGATILVKPVVVFTHQHLDELVDDFCIDASLGDVWEDQEEDDERRGMLNAFYKVRKKNTANRHYFRRVVEVYPFDDSMSDVYKELEREEKR